jgi:hypothetical protein
VYNNTNQPFLIVKGEWPSTTLFIPANANRTFNGEGFPWCDRSEQVRDRAFRFFQNSTPSGGGTGVFYVFQDYPSETIFWTLFNGGAPSYDQSRRTIWADSVNVTINANATPSVARV